MAVSRAERRRDRRERVDAYFGPKRTDAALDLLEIVELAWNDCYGGITPPEDAVDDMLLLSGGDLARLIGAARLGLSDTRDLKVAADAERP